MFLYCSYLLSSRGAIFLLLHHQHHNHNFVCILQLEGLMFKFLSNRSYFITVRPNGILYHFAHYHNEMSDKDHNFGRLGQLTLFMNIKRLSSHCPAPPKPSKKHKSLPLQVSFRSEQHYFCVDKDY